MQVALSQLLTFAGVMYLIGGLIGIFVIDRLEYLRRPSHWNRSMWRTFAGAIIGELTAFGGYATIAILVWNPVTPPVGEIGWIFTGVTLVLVAGFMQALAWIVARAIIDYDPDRANRPTVLH